MVVFNLAKTRQMRYRIDAQKAKMYLDTLKDAGVNPKDDYDRYVSEVIRTRGVAARELLGKELRAQSDQILAQVKIDRINMQESFTDAMVADIERVLARKDKDGIIRTHTFESLEYYINDIAERHHVPKTSVLVCMRQRVHEFYPDNRGELERLLKIFEDIQDIIELEAKP
jgi:hypothetical protein